MPAPRAVFLDWGGTLGHLPAMFDRPWQVWRQVGAELGLRLEEEAARRAIAETDLEFEGTIYQYHGRTREFWRRYDHSVMARLGVHELREELEVGLEKVFGDSSLIHLYPETLEVLGTLRRGPFHLGVVSNYHDGLKTILTHHGLDRFFDSISYSQEVGAEKPDPRIFRLALLRAGCLASEAVHVGDSFEADYEGSVRLGIRGIWLNRTQAPAPVECEQISDLRGLPPLLKEDR